jgi:hypothetical protein
MSKVGLEFDGIIYFGLGLGLGVAQPVHRRATGFTIRVRFPEVQDCSIFHRVEIDSGAHPASYPMVKGALPSGGKAAGTRN